MSKTKEVATQASAEALEQLSELAPKEASYTRTMFPRIAFKSQDVTEGKGKNKKVVMEAGTFVIERQTEEIDPETGNKVWDHTEMGDTIEGHIIFTRKQLRHYDKVTEEYTNSPIYDSDEEIVPLFTGNKKVMEGTPKDLKASFAYQDEDGKTKSNLKESRILYVLIDGEVHQMSLHGTSMYSFLSYARKNQVNTLLTKMSSEEQSKGSTEWNMVTFVPVRVVTQEEAETIIETVTAIKDGIQEEKEFYASQQMGDASAVVTAGPALEAGKTAEDDEEDF